MVAADENRPATLDLRRDVLQKRSGWVLPKPKEKLKRRLSDQEEEESCTSLDEAAKLVKSALCSHLPDDVVKAKHKKTLPHMKSFEAGVLFLDISGFTALCEKFSMSSKNGTDKLTKTLNGYMGQLAQEVINFDGDIMKYAGDAILTLWPVETLLDIQPTMYQIYKCCMKIQSKFGKWETDVGVTLRVKIGVSFGDVSVCYVGNDEFRHYVTNGDAVEKVGLAEKFCTSGDVVFSPSAWPHIRKLNIPFEYCSDDAHVLVMENLDEFAEEDLPEIRDYRTIRSVKTDSLPQATSKPEKRQRSMSIKSNMFSAHDITSMSIAEESKKSRKVKKGQFSSDSTVNTGNLARKTVCTPIDGDLIKDLRLYIARPVLEKMDHDQPLEYLSEMRQVSIVFINIVSEKEVKSSKWKQCKLLQSAFTVIYSTAKELQGCMNKIFMFDKGITFLVIFGLPGFKMENDCMHALQCGYRIKQALDNVPGINCTSIGVTTGSSFCGVVGHEHRHEYTVIGRKVNMAARLMMHYPDSVSCDNNTHYHSKLPAGDFIVLETKAMKGLVAVGTIREFREGMNQNADEVEYSAIQKFSYPILGRRAELELFDNIFEGINAGKHDATEYQLIVMKGEAGIGKSRMLESVLTKAQQSQMKVVTTALTLYDRNASYFTVKSLLMGLLGLNSVQSHQNRENIIVKTIYHPYVLSNLYMLNDFLGLKFVQSETQKNLGTEEWTLLLHTILSLIAEEMSKKFGFLVFGIDDAHFMDEESWRFIVDLSRNSRSLVVMTVKTGTLKVVWSETAASIMSNTSLTHTIQLTGLPQSTTALLACQLLKVSGIGPQVKRLLDDKSHGVPFWCEQILYQLLRENLIETVPWSASAHSKVIMPDPKLIQPIEDANPQAPGKKGVCNVCVVTDNFDWQNVEIPDTVKGIILTRIDTLNTTDQMVIKCASILGISFTQHLLCHVIDMHPRRLGTSLSRLMKEGLLVCDQQHQLKRDSGNLTPSGYEACTCASAPHDENEPDTGVRCQWLRFQSSSVQESAYEMFVEHTRTHLHEIAAGYFEEMAHRCKACGGGNFLFDPSASESERLHEVHSQSMNVNKKRGTIFQARHFPRNQRRVHTSTSRGSESDMIQEEFDVRDCRCPQVLHNVYPQLVRHWRAVLDVHKTLLYLQEAAAAAMATGEVIQAQAYLKEAEEMLEAIDSNKNPFTKEPNKSPTKGDISKWERARVHSLMGQVECMLGRLDNSVERFNLAMKLLGNPQPVTKFKTLLRISKERRTQWLHKRFPKRYIGKIKGDKSKWMIEQAHCLVHIFHNAIGKHNLLIALMSALQQVNCAEKVDLAVHELIIAYTSMMEYALMQNSKSRRLFRHYESKTKQVCQSVLAKMPNLQDLMTIVHVYITLVQNHLSCGRLSEAIDAANTAEEMIHRLHDKDSRLHLEPLMAEAMLMANRLPDFMRCVHALGQDQQKTGDMAANVAFHVCALDSMLNTGFQVYDIKDIVQYAKDVCAEQSFIAFPETIFSVRVKLGLWYMRTNMQPTALDWVASAELLSPHITGVTFSSNMPFLQLLEIKLLMLCHANAWNIEENIATQEDEVQQVLDMKSLTHVRPMCRPRLLHMQAYHAAIRGQMPLAQRLLTSAVNAAQDMELAYEAAWAEHSAKMWTESSDYNYQQDPWMKLSKSGMRVWEETHEAQCKCIMYTLPLPAWVSKRQKTLYT